MTAPTPILRGRQPTPDSRLGELAVEAQSASFELARHDAYEIGELRMVHQHITSALSDLAGGFPDAARGELEAALIRINAWFKADLRENAMHRGLNSLGRDAAAVS